MALITSDCAPRYNLSAAAVARLHLTSPAGAAELRRAVPPHLAPANKRRLSVLFIAPPRKSSSKPVDLLPRWQKWLMVMNNVYLTHVGH